MRMSNSPSHRLLDHRLLAQSNYRNSISPSSIYSEDEDRNSEQSGGGNLSSAQTVVSNLLGNTNHSSTSSAQGNTNNNQFPFAMNGNTNNQSELQQTLAAQQAANAAAAQLVRKLQQHNQLNNNSSNNNNSAVLAAAAAQLSNSSASNAFSNYSAFYNAAAAAISSGADLPLLGNINNLANSLKNSVSNSHALANVLNSSNGQANSSSNGASPQSPYVATNTYTEITYKGQSVAAFLAANKTPQEYLLCLPQAFELFLKHLVGGLHTVYTKLKRLDIVPIVCNVEQVRILRSRGAIQPGVNRCKLLSTKDFDVLYKDCTTARNSPGIGSLHAFNGNSNNLANSSSNNVQNTNNSNQANSNQNSSGNQSNNSNPMLGSADFNTTAAYLWLLSQQQQNNNSSNRNSSSSNGNNLLNGDLISPNSNTNHNSSTNGSSLTNNALSALNLTRSLTSLASGGNLSANQTNTGLISSNNNNSKANNHQLDESTDEDDLDDEMDDSPSESLRGSHSNLSNIDNHQNLFNGFKGENNNRTETPNTNDQLNNNQNNNQMNNMLGPALLNSNKENDAAVNKDKNKEQLPFGQLGLSNLMNNNDDVFRGLNRSNNSDLKNGNGLLLSQNISSIGNNLSTNTDSLESLLRNIENLVSIAVQNARQQQQQLNLHKAELRAELLNVAEKERDFREQLERQLNEEQRIRLLYQKRFKKERRFRKKIEIDLQQVQNKTQQSDRNSPLNDKITNSNGRSISPIKQQQQIKTTTTGNSLNNGDSPSYGSPSSTHENLKENSLEEKEEMAVD